MPHDIALMVAGTSYEPVRAGAGERCCNDATPKPKTPARAADRQHLTNLAQSDPWTVRHSVGATIYRLKVLAEADGALARGIDGL